MWARILSMASRSCGGSRESGSRPASNRSKLSAAWLTLSTCPSSESTITGSGRLSMAACEACCAWSSSPSELLRYSLSLSAMVSSSRPTSAISSLPSIRARASRSPSPMRRTARLSRRNGRSARRVSETEARRPSPSAEEIAISSSVRLRSAVPRARSLLLMAILVDLQDPLGRVLDAEEGGLQLVEIAPAQLLLVAEPAVGPVLRHVLAPGRAKRLRRLRFPKLGDVALLHLQLRFESPDVGGRQLIGLVRPPGSAKCRSAVHALHGVPHALRCEHAAKVVAQDQLGALAQRFQGVERDQPDQHQARGQRRLRQQQAAPERHWRSSPLDATTCRSKSPPSRSRRVRTEPSNTCFHQGCRERPTTT